MDPRLHVLPGETLIFVYGTLLSGQRNHGLLRGAEFHGDARTAARYLLVDHGDHPGLATAGTTSVVGELYAVDATMLARLDAFEAEDDDYRRESVVLDNGGTADAWLMSAARATSLPAIPSGSWRITCAERASAEQDRADEDRADQAGGA